MFQKTIDRTKFLLNLCVFDLSTNSFTLFSFKLSSLPITDQIKYTFRFGLSFSGFNSIIFSLSSQILEHAQVVHAFVTFQTSCRFVALERVEIVQLSRRSVDEDFTFFLNSGLFLLAFICFGFLLFWKWIMKSPRKIFNLLLLNEKHINLLSFTSFTKAFLLKGLDLQCNVGLKSNFFYL